TTSKDAAGLATSYTYDALGRVRRITPPAAAELSTFVCYEGPSATSAYRASAAQTCPVAASNPNAATWQHYEYDGLARLVRERRLQPGSAVVKRFTLFDGPGNAYFSSEWVPDATSETVTRDLATSCAFNGGNLTGRARPSAAPGTFRMCYDPFGRPQQIVGAKMSSLVTVDRTDGGTNTYSDTREAVLTYCLNAAFSNLSTPTCAAGGLNATTTTQRDAFGRITSVIEPTGEITTHAYDVNGKLTGVTQGVQGRTFTYDANGFLRSESTPEAGAVSYASVGSLGNVRQETRPGGVVLRRTFDFAGRLTEEDAGGNKHLVNCYDGKPVCSDGSPGSGGGPHPAGKLTHRYGYNRIPTLGPVVDEQFEYGDAGGRLSRLVAGVGNGNFAALTAQTWTYGNLGLVAAHGHPRSSGTFNVAPVYTNGMPTAIAAGGANVVTAASYGPAALLSSWTAGTSGTGVVTTIAPDATGLPRPASISNTLWSSGAYSYDGAGNVLKTGTDAFTYDSRSRLLSAKYGATTRSFAYDRYGNLTSNGAAIAVDPRTNQVTSGSADYDAAGNMIAYNGESMTYDPLGRQYRNTNASGDWIFLFNGAGERVAKFPAKFTVLRREMARYLAEANMLAKGWGLPGCSGAFSDVACSDPDARYIQLVYDRGITAGCLSNPLSYCPDAALSRAQMAVFLVKGYKPDGFAPPACVGTFSDVGCSGPYAAFAPWIEQLYRDGVTSGCNANPLSFCPGNTVGEWEMLVWLAKAPGAMPGTTIWNAYHPMPRGSTYTLRDESNRVVTEMAGGSTGPATATLSVTRDNVFLGNLLVASYVASPPGWLYTASDHLGSPAIVFNQARQAVDSHKFWPFGEDTNTVPPGQRLGYCLMEKEEAAARDYDHARTHDIGLGRFLSPDLVGGHPRNPQSWNRYAYTLGNPMKHFDPDGLLTIVVHGTQIGKRGSDFTPAGPFFSHVARSIGDRATVSYNWSGRDNHEARVDAAKGLVAFIRSYKFAPGEGLDIIAHSHGGNVAIAAINMGLGHKVDNLVTLGTPSTPAYRLNGTAGVSNWVNVFNVFDKVQTHGGGADDSPLQSGAAARTQPLATNLELDEDLGPFASHSWLHSPEAWDGVFPYLKKIQAFGAPMFLWVTR
ncbi:MAG TPA: RHS repeat-associated core domain-containing protein, partial [Thermoanaerobaculia bacterium]|nr:RHS repeat-associated core domain-containing protein [Thermoanaerobaculia bacterium]